MIAVIAAHRFDSESVQGGRGTNIVNPVPMT
jgi:hypothetical protein